MREAGDILGVSDKVRNRQNPKAVIKYVLEQVVHISHNIDKLQKIKLMFNDDCGVSIYIFNLIIFKKSNLIIYH